MKKITISAMLMQEFTSKQEPTPIDGYEIAPGLGIHKAVKGYITPVQFHKSRWTIVHIPTGYAISNIYETLQPRAVAVAAALELAKLADWTQDKDTLHNQLDGGSNVREILESFYK